MSTTPIGLSSAGNTTGTSASSTGAITASPTENEFLQLLVAQLKYQDPSQPADGTEFVSELAQFTDVSNTTNMSSDLNSILQLMENSAAATPAAAAPSTSPTPSANSTSTPVTGS